MTNYIHEYYQAIKDGSIVVGRWILLLYEYIIRGLETKSFYFAPKKADRAIKFIENYCHHSKGRNDLLKLELWQKALVSVIFGVVDENNYRQFREVILVVARKNGKSLFAAAVAEYMAFLDDEYGAEIYCLAPKLEQAEIIYSCFWQMCQMEDEIKDRIRSRKSDYYIEESNTTIKKIAFNAKKSDGFNPHMVVCDEIASWVGDAGLKQYEVMKSALGARRQPLILSCTTSGYVNDGIYDELVLRGTRFLLGDSKEKRILPVFYMIDDIEKWNDINELHKSNPNLGVSVSIDYLLEEIAVAEGSLSKKTEFITKYCCLKQNSSQAWLDTKTIKKMCAKKFTIDDFRHSYCVAGVDLSQTTDLTAAIILIEKEGHLYVFGHFWMPSEKLEEATAKDGLPYAKYIKNGWLTLSGDNFIDYHDCFNWLVNFVEEYEILPLQVGYDRYSAQYLVQDLKAYGFQCDDVYQGDNLWGVLQEMEGLFKDGKVHIGDNDLLKIHLLNAAIKFSTERGRGRLIKLRPTEHIDGTAAMSDAFCVRQKWYEQLGEQLKNAS
jgi:phage terminase large subunit-like protein